jgi:DNA-nicking Smr family endonuclease
MTARRASRLAEADAAAWERFTQGVTPLGHRASDHRARRAEEGEVRSAPIDHAKPATTASAGISRRTAHLAGGIPRSRASNVRDVAIGAAPGGLDRATWQRFRSGRLPPARTLDLHGMSVQHAFMALSAFLHAAQADCIRCVEIVTGRGSARGTGVLRRELPHWMNRPDLRPLLLGAAYPHPSNPGAVRLLLRRRR